MVMLVGYCITDSGLRMHVLHFLQRIEKLMGWSTSETGRLLQSEWEELD